MTEAEKEQILDVMVERVIPELRENMEQMLELLMLADPSLEDRTVDEWLEVVRGVE